jgi:hypothetical protein
VSALAVVFGDGPNHDRDTLHRAGCPCAVAADGSVAGVDTEDPAAAEAEYVEWGFESGALHFAPCVHRGRR